uniref:Ribosome assembly factor mrt4 n=1 Tax=Compsopogon caeruleus TaxID=31354 RepID=A0A7S1XBV9_9RHOD|mmetsp:Transcript_12064/g.24563  ORF Transcript_12064/g.24563 Transcript_12064/m.24563 type:complete len:224 (+) Transcript_12064:105-776(+)
MPKAKRNRIVTLSKLSGRGISRDVKGKVIERVRQLLDDFPRIYVFRVENMRTTAMTALRAELRADTRFFLGRNKVMQVAVGKDPASEHLSGSSELGPFLKTGNGVFGTTKEHKDVLEYFSGFEAPEFARSGFVANTEIILSPGHLANFEPNQENELRSLGLPVSLMRGKVMLNEEFVVCKIGDTLTPEKAKIAKLLGIPMAHFRIELIAMWEKETGSVLEIEA